MAVHVQQQPRLPFASTKPHLTNLASVRQYGGLPPRKDSRTAETTTRKHQQSSNLPKVKPGKLTEAYGEPPAVVYREASRRSPFLQREELLGEGGFARVYACIDSADNVRKALKVISKKQLTTPKNKQKLYAEIKLHQVMVHGNIVRFEECFEDDDNVYMVLELCPNGSLLDLLKRRKRYTEPEARYYLVQLLCACDYMHTRSVIHRDLKLGNLFLDKRMNLKVGDFGLAALVQYPGERKKTVCGTPNYIAPEILFDKEGGHSFEADVWSIGVILYTFLVGRPPFQTKEVKEIYQKIKDGEYFFPHDANISDAAISLIDSILHPNPRERPTLHDILQHPFLSPSLPFPRSISTLSLDRALDWSHLTAAQSEQHMRACMEAGNLPLIAGEAEPMEVLTKRPLKRKASRDVVYQDLQLPGNVNTHATGPHVTEIPQAAIKQVAKAQETEVKHALAPDSPISELLNSARKPLVVSPAPNRRKEVEDHQPMPRMPMAAVAYNPVIETAPSSGGVGGPCSPSAYAAAKRLSNYQPQKGTENVPVTTAAHAIRSDVAMGRAPSSPVKLRSIKEHAEEQLMQSQNGQRPMSGLYDDGLIRLPPSIGFYETCWRTLSIGLGVRSQDAFAAMEVPTTDQPPKVFISLWVDYTSKYGMAYQLTDGSTGVSFNDATTMIMAPNQARYDYISNKQGSTYNRRNQSTTESAASDLKYKLRLLNHLKAYMAKQLVREVAWTFVDTARTKQMDFLVKSYRLNTAIIFRLSNNVLQFNFFADHTKLLLSERATLVTIIGADCKLKTYSLAKLIHDAARLNLIDPDMPSDKYDFVPQQGAEPLTDPRLVRKQAYLQGVLQKLVYCMDILRSLMAKNRDSQPAEGQ